MTKPEIETIIGEPDFWMIAQIDRNEKHTSPIWRFGNLELQFDQENMLSSIYNDHLIDAGIHGGNKLKVKPWFMRYKKQRFTKVLAKLDAASIKFDKKKEVIKIPDSPRIELRLHLDSEVELLFKNECDEDHLIKKEQDFLLYAFEKRINKSSSLFKISSIDDGLDAFAI